MLYREINDDCSENQTIPRIYTLGASMLKSGHARTCSNHSDSMVKVAIALLRHMQQHSEFLRFAQSV
jgi:hypothetical protein